MICPPLAFAFRTIFFLASHCAYKVMFLVGVYTLLGSPTLVPPVLAVHQPVQLYPALIGVGNVTFLVISV